MWAWENRLGTAKRPRHKMIAEVGRAERMKSYCASISDAGGRGSVGCSEEGRLWLGDAQHTEVFCDEFASASTEMSSS